MKGKHREVQPDIKYKNIWISKFINGVMMKGKKGLATKIVHNVLEATSKKTGEPVHQITNKVQHNISPSSGTVSKKYGGTTYNVPIEYTESQSHNRGVKTLVKSARALQKTNRDHNGKVTSRKKCRTIEEALTSEILACFRKEKCGTIEAKEQSEKNAISNKAFAYLGDSKRSKKNGARTTAMKNKNSTPAKSPAATQAPSDGGSEEAINVQ